MSELVDADALRFLGHCLEAYMQWRRETNRLGFRPTMRTWDAPEMVENRRVLNLCDDQFVLIDQAYAKSSWRRLLEIEYCSPAGIKQKMKDAGYFGPNYGAVSGRYKRDLGAAEAELYFLLLPDIEEWRAECIHLPTRDRRRFRK